MDRIIGLTVPGCDSFAFEYGTNEAVIESFSGPTDCIVDFNASSDSYTTLTPTTNTDITNTDNTQPIPFTNTEETSEPSEHCLFAEDMECGSQAVNLGEHISVESCALKAALEPQCGDYIMFSEGYSDSSEWGCICCSHGE